MGPGELYLAGPVTALAMLVRFQRECSSTARPAPAVKADCHTTTLATTGPESHFLTLSDQKIRSDSSPLLSLASF